jgi:rSAM/selenodomain-associated transferase 1
MTVPPAAARLVIFLKAPRPGQVKTRLAQTIGDAPACAAYRELVEVLLESLSTLSNVELRYSPEDGLPEIQSWLRAGWQARPQGAGDLGRRLEAATAESFATNSERVVIIGSDCPTIMPSDIQDAWRALATHDLVLGPATDGGYWLIGLRSPCPALFRNIHWSTDQVLAQTRERAETSGLTVYLLREQADVDTAADWAKYRKLNAC